jgi:hypothetical protein
LKRGDAGLVWLPKSRVFIFRCQEPHLDSISGDTLCEVLQRVIGDEHLRFAGFGWSSRNCFGRSISARGFRGRFSRTGFAGAD